MTALMHAAVAAEVVALGELLQPGGGVSAVEQALAAPTISSPGSSKSQSPLMAAAARKTPG